LHDFVITYANLVIAMITFVAPIMLFLLSIFSHGIVVVKKKADEEKRQIQTLLTFQLTQQGSTDVNTVVGKSYKSLRDNEEIINKKLNLLNPKRQIVRTFSFLFSSLTLIMGDMLLKDKAWKVYSHWGSVSLILGSFLSLAYALYILHQVGWEIIDTKRILAEEATAVEIKNEGS
jgi:heme/copper-type cytochrome/quinol oxidase subunit 3